MMMMMMIMTEKNLHFISVSGTYCGVIYRRFGTMQFG